MKILIVVLSLIVASQSYAETTLSKFIEPANLCPVYPEQHIQALAKLANFRESLKKGPECSTLGEKLKKVEAVYDEDEYKKIKSLIQNKDGRVKELSEAQVEQVTNYAREASSAVTGFVELFSKNRKCWEKDERPSLLSNISSVIQTTTNIVGRANGPGGIPLQVGGNLFAGVLSGIDNFISKGSGYKFSKKAEHRQLFSTQLCIYNDIRAEAEELIRPENRIQFLNETFQKKYLVAKYKYLTNKYPVCKQLSNYYYQTNFYMRDINKLKDWVESIKMSDETEYEKCLEINSQVHKNKKSAFLKLKDSLNEYPFGYSEIQQAQSGSVGRYDDGSSGTYNSGSSETDPTLDWIDHVRRTDIEPTLDDVSGTTTIADADGRVVRVVVQESAAMVVNPYHTPYDFEEKDIETAREDAEKIIEAIEIPTGSCSDTNVQRANIKTLVAIENYTSLLTKNIIRVIEDLKDEANKSDDVFGETVGDFLLTTINKHAWAKSEIHRIKSSIGPGSDSGSLDLRKAVYQLDERLFGVLAPEYLNYFIKDGMKSAKNYRKLRSDWLKDESEARGEMLFSDHLKNIADTVPANDQWTHAEYFASIEGVARPLESALFAANSINEYCYFFAISGTYVPEIVKECKSEDYAELTTEINSYDQDIFAIHNFVAFEKQNIGIASSWSHVLLRKIENWFNYRGVDMQALLE